jgi:hypothetical protein
MTVKEIVKEYLEKNGYDGLCGGDCGCGLDDFMPCAQFALEGVPTCCTPAYKHTCNSDCTNCGDDELCELIECYSTEKKGK